MPEASRPTLDEIAVVFAHLADRVAAERARALDPVVRLSIARAIHELRRHIPGLYPPADASAASALASASADALRRGRLRAALARALRGLSFSPHHPELYYLAGSACLQFAATEEAVRLFQHALWIHPGYLPARQDLEAISAFHEDVAPPVESNSSDPPEQSGACFELLDEERQGRLWREDELEEWERSEGEFPEDDSDAA